MGIKLRELSSPKKIKINDLAGNVIAIDGFNTLYQFLTTIRGQSGEPLMDSKGRITSHQSGLFYRNINLLIANIKPIYVLDGKPSILKKIIIEKRKETREKMKEKYYQALEEGKIEEAKEITNKNLDLNFNNRFVQIKNKILLFLNKNNIAILAEKKDTTTNKE